MVSCCLSQLFSVPRLIITLVTLSDRDWLSYKKGEILFTDGLKRLCGPSEHMLLTSRRGNCASGADGYPPSSDKMEVILAQNTAGAIGCKSSVIYGPLHFDIEVSYVRRIHR